MPPASRYDEKTLLARIATGDETAFRKLFELYKERFYSVALKMTQSDEVAKDIVQDIFMSIWSKRENLVHIDNPPSYFFTAVYRRVYHHYRKIALERKLIQGVAPLESENTTDEMVIAHESKNLVSLAVQKLPPQQQIVFKLSKQEGFSREDIARKLQISPNTVKNHLANAVKFVRAFLGNSVFIYTLISCFFKK